MKRKLFFIIALACCLVLAVGILAACNDSGTSGQQTPGGETPGGEQPSTPAYSEGLSYRLNSDGQSYTVTGIGECTDTELIIQQVYNDLPVTSIERYAFYGCSGLTSVTISDSVTSIGDNAFNGCSSLTFVIIPDGVTSVGSYAFQDCTGLTIITIPDSVTSIGSGAFGVCSSLKSITIPFVGASKEGRFNTYFSYIFGGSVPASLKEVIITGDTSIGEAAFSGCDSLTSVTIPDGVTSIGEGAFSGCSGLTSITIPDSVTSIGEAAFSGCGGLTAVHIADIVAWCGIDFDGYLSNPLYYAHNLYLNGVLVTDLVIPDSVTSIDDSSFSGCTGLASVTIPDSVTSIGVDAFYNCTGLTSVTIGDGVTSIGSHAFDGCSSLESITIPFVGATKEGAQYTDFGYIFGTYSGGYVPASLKKVIITGGTSIGNNAFSGCTGLTSVTIPDSVTSIGSYAFRYCRGLTSINYNGTRAQWNTVSKNSYWRDGSAITKVVCSDWTVYV